MSISKKLCDKMITEPRKFAKTLATITEVAGFIACPPAMIVQWCRMYHRVVSNSVADGFEYACRDGEPTSILAFTQDYLYAGYGSLAVRQSEVEDVENLVDNLKI